MNIVTEVVQPIIAGASLAQPDRYFFFYTRAIGPSIKEKIAVWLRETKPEHNFIHYIKLELHVKQYLVITYTKRLLR